MKTAVSLPDELFGQAEATARRLRLSRSELYAKALAEFLHRQNNDAITEKLNQVYTRASAKLDAGLHRTQLDILSNDP